MKNKSARMVELEERIRAAGYRVSAGSWEDDTHVCVFSVEGCGPATYGHPKMEFMERRKVALQTSWDASIGT